MGQGTLSIDQRYTKQGPVFLYDIFRSPGSFAGYTTPWISLSEVPYLD